MPRPKENKVVVHFKVSPEAYEELRKKLIKGGFVYGDGHPGWADWGEATGQGDVVMYVKSRGIYL